jgi:3-phenylpropionate/cinnamic acid dioxygenase small subunit
MTDDITAVAVVVGVHQLLADYAHACDDRRFEDFASLFTENAAFVVNGEQFDGPAGARRWLERAAANPAGTHLTTNVTVEPRGPDRATSVAAFTFYRREAGTGKWQIINIGRYHDELVRTPGGWRFAAREIILH